VNDTKLGPTPYLALIARYPTVLIKLGNVAIANALQLEAARATLVALSRFNYDTMPSLTSMNLSITVL